MNLGNLVLIALLFTILLYPVAGQRVSYEITITLSENQAHEAVKITLNNTGTFPFEDFSYLLPADATGIKVYDSAGSLSPDIATGDAIVITSNFRSPLQPGTEETLTIEFDTFELVSIVEGEHIFSALFSPPGGSSQLGLRISLPRGMGLPNPISSGARTDIAPLPDQTISDGTTTTFVWNVDPADELAVFIRYSPLIQSSTTLPAAVTTTFTPVPQKEDSKIYWLFVPLFIAIFLIGYYRFRGGGDGLENKTEFMKDDERIIIDLVRENAGIVQKRLGDHTGFSKAKVSKIISELERRKIVRVERVGRRNKLFLSEEFKKK